MTKKQNRRIKLSELLIGIPLTLWRYKAQLVTFVKVILSCHYKLIYEVYLENEEHGIQKSEW